MKDLLTDSDRKTRKNWLVVTIFMEFFLFLESSLEIFLDPRNTSAEMIGQLIGAFIASFLFFLILFYFAYKKFGTKWLTWCIFSTAVAILRLAPKLFSSSSYPFFVLLNIGLAVWWLLASEKLRKLNKVLKLLFRVTPAFREKLELLQNITDKVALNQYYGELVRECPALEPLITREYNKAYLGISAPVGSYSD